MVLREVGAVEADHRRSPRRTAYGEARTAAANNTHSLWCRKQELSTIAGVNDLWAAFGRRVRRLRHKFEVSQEELADRAGLHCTYLGGIERGERNPALINIGPLAVALGVSIAELFSTFAEPPRHRKRGR